ncbi:50S ribosomal protein L15e [Candidatus Woesearchaeota archaeon]|nr:50S ribosomal protein L15e [Nanoarchaeota archaeon]MCB9370466.1 50S ribosomal protein L15e [Candidatus Woesearchaeota archaeon]USN43545.1 MAG: 50S ribosomal protein L15e [Candidatus Woesearchaeota archaeon]
MGYLKYVKEAWKKPRETLGEEYRQRLIEWRRGLSIERVEYPTRPDRAHALGYKAKQGVIVTRVRVKRGGKNNPRIMKGRSGGNLSTRIAQSKNYQWICEERAQKRYPNMEVLGSYWVGQDEYSYWYEVLLLDVYHPQIMTDKELHRYCSNKHTKRVMRGLTSAGRKSRGLQNKGFGAEKARPSIRANGGRMR